MVGAAGLERWVVEMAMERWVVERWAPGAAGAERLELERLRPERPERRGVQMLGVERLVLKRPWLEKLGQERWPPEPARWAVEVGGGEANGSTCTSCICTRRTRQRVGSASRMYRSRRRPQCSAAAQHRDKVLIISDRNAPSLYKGWHS